MPHGLNGLPQRLRGESGDAPSEARLAAKEKGKEGILFLSSSFPGAPPPLTPGMLVVVTFGSLGVRSCVYQSLLVVEMALCDRQGSVSVKSSCMHASNV